MNKILKKLPNTAFFRFIKQYPRVSIFIGLVLLIIFLLLPASLGRKIKMLLLSVLLGFFVALGIKYFLFRRKNERTVEKDQ